nr:NAD(P)H-binding protein [uncultured Marinifilum sp.]
MKQITILGATGMLGEKLLQKAIDKNIKVKVLARNTNKLGNFMQAIEVINGNYFDKEKLQSALMGSEVILSTIGPDTNSSLSADDEDNYINSLAFIIKQMNTNKQKRWISISSAGVKRTNENLPLARKLLRVRLMAASKSIINIKDRELHLLEQSNLDWTSVRPPFIKEEIKGEFVADENKFIANAVDVNQLCDFILAEIINNDWIKSAPVVGTK